MKKILALVATASLMFSCSQEEIIPDVERIPINISVGQQTRANDTTYENRDEVGIYVVNYDGSTVGSLQEEGNQVDNMRFEYNDNGGTWTPDTPIYWKDKSTSADFYAYYPYDASANVSAHSFSVKADQSAEVDFWASDFLWGKATKVSPTKSAVPIVTNHTLSRILVDIKPGNGFTENTWAAATKSVKICDVKTSATIDLSTGIATATGNNGEIIPLATAVNSTANSYKAMMIPQEVADNSKLIVVTVDDVDYVYRKGFTFKANTQHKFSVTINKTGANVDVTIGEWEIDNTINEGDIEEEGAYIEEERNALMALYNATGGDNWKNSTNWCSGLPVSEWYGVEVDEDGYVISLYFSENNLVGAITSELGDLTRLKKIICNSNELSELNVSRNPLLNVLNCEYNKLESIDVSNNPELEILNCSANNISSLDVSNNLGIKTLICYQNSLTSIDISNNLLLENLNCHNNQITNLDVSNNQNLDILRCYINNLTSINVDKNFVLRELSCYENQITAIDVSNNSKLAVLSISANPIKTLDVSNNSLLRSLFCINNQLTELNVRNNKLLENLNCSENYLTNLDVTNNLELYRLVCYSNNLTSLNVDKNINLEVLAFYINKINTIDISKNSKLTTLACQSNLLSTLDITNNPLLKILSTLNNPNLESISLKSGHSFDELYIDESTELEYK